MTHCSLCWMWRGQCRHLDIPCGGQPLVPCESKNQTTCGNAGNQRGSWQHRWSRSFGRWCEETRSLSHQRWSQWGPLWLQHLFQPWKSGEDSLMAVDRWVMTSMSTHELYNVISGIHIWLGCSRTALTPSYFEGSHTKYSSRHCCRRPKTLKYWRHLLTQIIFLHYFVSLLEYSKISL